MNVSPRSEKRRLAALRALRVLDTAPEAAFDDVVRAASLVCGVPISLVSLVDAERQWFKANIGLAGVTETPRAIAFCGHAIEHDNLFEINDAREDERFRDNPLVTADPGIRFYSGAPLTLSDGSRVGTLCVIDRKARSLNDEQREILRCLARTVARLLEAHKTASAQRQASAALARSEKRLRRLYEATPAMLHSLDLQDRLVTVSDAWLATLGYDRHDVIGRRISEFMAPPDRDRAPAVVTPAPRESARAERIPCQMLRANGEIADIRMSVIEDYSDAGFPTSRTAVLEDVTLSARVEHELEEERLRLRAIVDATRVATWQWNVEHGSIVVNERWAEQLGYTLAELSPITTRTLFSRIHVEDRTRAKMLLREHFLRRHPSFEDELRFRHRDGSWVWLLTCGQVMSWTADAKPAMMFGTQQDITGRKEQEAALRKSEQFLGQTSRVAGVGGWELDLTTNALQWSPETCLIHGVAPDYQPTLENAIAFYAPEARAAIREAVSDGLARGSSWDLELPLIRSDGAHIWVRAVGTAIVADGIPVRLVGAFQDVTERVAERNALREANERVTLATESGGIGIWEWDLADDRMMSDARCFKLYGLEPHDRPQSSSEWLGRVHPDDVRQVEDALQNTLLGLNAYDTEFRVIWEDGSVHHLRACGNVTRDGAGRPLRFVGANWDVTELRRLTANLAEQHELLRVTLRSIGDGVITTDAQGNVVWLNPVAQRLTGWSTEEATGHPATRVFNIFDETAADAPLHPILSCIEHGGSSARTKHTVLMSRNGDRFGIEDSVAPIRSDRGDILGAVLVFRDVTEQRRLSHEMSYRASHDALTGLVNRAECEVQLGARLDSARVDHASHALLYIDLDQFKVVNDTCGHAVGDELLQQVTSLLQEAVRTTDTLARLGGDEFAIILDHCSIEHAERAAQQICDRMDGYRFVHEGRRFRIGASIGLVPVDARWPTTAAILQAADSSCYAAKESGRNRFVTYVDSDHAISERRGEMQWTTRIEQALDDDRFALFAQRIVPLAHGDESVHAEVLLRMVDADGALILPGAFLPAAERFNLASRIDRWVLTHTVRWLKSLPSLDFVHTLSINVSGQSVGDLAFHHWAHDALADAGRDICSKLCLEITETAAITNLVEAAEFIQAVRTRGVTIALDDFGAGSSSFGYLKALAVDFLKIDGQFIRSLAQDPLSEATVRCFVEVAKIIGVRTVAEFVDTPILVDHLIRLGVDFAQGYQIHRPAPIEQLEPARSAIPRAAPR